MSLASIDRFKVSHRPGVYIFKNSKGDILYVGKAIDLYHRVASYFKKDAASWAKRIADIETVIVESEMEALLLEANLIKKYLPPFNIRLTDDKDYLYIAVTKEAFPKIISARKKDLIGVKEYWGPFPSARTVRDTLKPLRKVFPWCANLQSGIVKLHPIPDWKAKRACFYFHISLCPGPCAGVISQPAYNQIIRRFSQLMDGKKDRLLKELASEMKQESDNQNFEKAAKIKKTIEGVLYLTQINRTKLYLENPNFLQEESRLALEQLKEDLNLKRLPERIEGYDISNIGGHEATGSMVVLTSGEIDKSQYRKFKIKMLGKPNDVGMLKETLERRLKHQEWPMPDLIIMDGGRGQARAAKLKIENCKLKIPLFGLAKKREWLYPPEGEVIKLPRKSLSLKLLQKLRDEAHRFAITYHRKLRGKMILE